jgi:hypothetical protein
MIRVAPPDGERSLLGDGPGPRREPRSVQHGPPQALGALGIGGVASDGTVDREPIARLEGVVSDGRMGHERTKQVGYGDDTYMSESQRSENDSRGYDTHGY